MNEDDTENCANTIPLKFENFDLFRAPFHWIFIGKNIIDDIQCKYHNKIHLLPDNDIILVEPSNSTWRLKQSYKVHKSVSDVIIEDYGTWDKKHGFIDNRATNIASRRRRNLRGVSLQTTTIVLHKFSLSHLTDHKDTHIDTVPRLNSLLVDLLLYSLNSKRETYLVFNLSNNNWGYRLPNSSQFTGMIGQLQRKEIDISGCAIFITKERLSAIKFLHATTPARALFVFRQPPLSYISNVYTLPFSGTVWIAQILLTALMGVILYLNLAWEKITRGKNDPDYQTIETSETILIVIGAICQQGSPIDPKGGPGRTVMFILFMALMFLFTSFSANIVALLQSSSNSIQTLEDLLNSKLEFGVQNETYNRHYFRVASDPIRKGIYEKKVAPPGKKENFMTIDEGMRRLRTEPFAFHIEVGALYSMIAKQFTENEKCGLMEIEYLQVVDPFLVTQRNSPYLELFKNGMLHIHERGLLRREFNIFIPEKPKCLGTGNTFSSIGLNEIVAAFYIILIGMSLALIIAGIEYFSVRTNNNRTFVVDTSLNSRRIM
ncbi:glutamate receptor U1-like [Chrysoperla carnea]|uniref:glutamate receptor U1-like n=1 Tax=Chrysoperla carnea TaxID=189513 RepID=UPI001D06DBEF|nr:glutamate receptor U1-like [Chrysoperla carnea]